jgi:hypothetical protein
MSTNVEQPKQGTLALNVEVKSAKDLKFKENNTRLHDKKNLEAIEKSVEETGFNRSIFIDEDGTALAGNGTLQIAQKRDAKVIIVDVEDENTVVAVRKRGMTPLEKERAGLWDNRASDLSKNDKKAIARLTQQQPAQMLLGGIFTEKEQEKLLKAQADALPLGAGGKDDAERETQNAAVRGDSTVRMVSLFLTTAEGELNHGDFVRRVRALQSSLFPEAKTITDAVVAIVNRARDEWLRKDSEENVAAEAEGAAV